MIWINDDVIGLKKMLLPDKVLLHYDTKEETSRRDGNVELAQK